MIPLWATKTIRNLFKIKLRIFFCPKFAPTAQSALSFMPHLLSSKDSAAKLYSAPSS